MTKRFSMKPGGFEMQNSAGTDVFDTERPSIGLVQSAELQGTVSLGFPNLVAAPAEYLYSGGSREGNGKAPFAESCSTYGRIADQDWGPPGSERSRTIARVLLGTVPEDTNLIDVQAKFSRTTAPANVLGNPIIVAIKEGQWTSLFDGSAILEDKGLIKRQVHVELIGTNVYASLYQSAAAQRVVAIQTKTNLNVFYQPADPPFAELVAWQYGPANPNPCSRSFSINLASTWSMQFKILPGRARNLP